MKYTENQVKEILNDIILNVYGKNPVILKDLWDARGEQEYIDFLHAQYEKILIDLNEIFGNNSPPGRILEISAFLGVTDVALAKMGYEVHTFDIPEFQENTKLHLLYAEHNVQSSVGFIKDIWKTGLPYPDNYFDAVLLSEVIEHLNFNPLPVLQEINRILKFGGILYITTPNQANLLNRITIILGGSIRNPLIDSVTQLDQAKNAICGIHWREYTLEELRELLEITGFSLKKYSFSDNAVKSRVRRRFFLTVFGLMSSIFHSFQNSLIVIGEKKEYRPIQFRFNEEYIKYYPNRGYTVPGEGKTL